MTADSRSLAAWQSPSIGLIAPLDIAAAVIVLLLLPATFIGQMGDYIFRARMAEALVATGTSRINTIEQYAISGEPIEMQPAAEEMVLPGSAQEHLAGARGRRPPPPRPPKGLPHADERAFDELRRSADRRALQRDSIETGAQASRYVSSLRLDGSVSIATSVIDGAEYELALYPAAQDVPVPQVLAWQCGRNRMPDGWLGPTPELARPVAEHRLPAPCRGPKATR